MDSRQYIAKAAKMAVTEVGPRVWELTGIPGNKLRFIILGCQGSGSESQKTVMKLMNQLCVEFPDIAFVLGTGDNVYDYGASSPLIEEEDGFRTCFYDIYANKKFSAIARLPFFMILGNHDANRHKMAHLIPFSTIGAEVERNETGHTYTPQGSLFPTVASKKELFLNNTIPVRPFGKAPKWIMPYEFGSYIAGKTQIFYLNANSFAQDFLNWKTDKEEKEEDGKIKTNQAEWLFKNYASARENGYQIVTALHNPFKTINKRAFPKNFDTGHYLNTEQVTALQKILNTKATSYSELLYLCWKEVNHWQKAKPGSAPDVLCCAHDHAMTYYNDRQNEKGWLLCQIGSGGGGGDLQKRRFFSRDPYFATYLKNYGVSVFTCDLFNPKSAEIDIYTTAGHHLKFNSVSHEPVREINQDPAVESLRKLVLEACMTYFENKAKDSNASKGIFNSITSTLFSGAKAAQRFITSAEEEPDDVDRIHNIMAYLNQPKLEKCSDVLFYLDVEMRKISDRKTFYSFNQILGRTIKEKEACDQLIYFYDQLVLDHPPNSVPMLNFG